MASRIAAGTVLLALMLGGCAGEPDGVPPGCLAGPQVIGPALERAPAAVTLPDATKLSTCISRSRSDGDLQTLGSALLTVADGLRARAARDDDVAALRLGYLVGAVRRGVGANPGLATQLGRRLEQTMRLDGPSAAARAALRSGLRAGEAGG